MPCSFIISFGKREDVVKNTNFAQKFKASPGELGASNTNLREIEAINRSYY